MGSKKRSSGSAEEVVDQGDTQAAVTTSKQIKKRKFKNAEGVKPKVDSRVFNNPMEKKKKKKESDKERHHIKSEEKEMLKPKIVDQESDCLSRLPEASESSQVPVLHISVFKDLSSANPLVREEAAETLVMELREVQEAHERLGEAGSVDRDMQLEAEKDEGLRNCAPSLRYALRRLVRGVSSSRECARQGFALGLAIVVGTIPSIKLDSLMKLIGDLLEVSSSMKGQEARECLLARLFSYGALARSGRIAKEWILDKNTSIVREFISHIIALADKKSYLREPAVSIILDLVEKLPVEALLTQVLAASGMQNWFQRATENGNPDALLLALKLRERISSDNEMFCKLLPHPFSPNKLYGHEHLVSLVPCFKESTFCQPRVHSVWPVLVDILFSDVPSQEDSYTGHSSSKKLKKNRKCKSFEEEIAKNLHCFCDVVIEGALLSSSHDRKRLAFDILLLLLPRLPSSCIQIVFSNKLIHCLLDILSTKDSWLYKAAQYFLNELSNWARKDDERRVGIVLALQKHSNGRFDAITRTHIVKDLVSEFQTASGSILFVQSMMSLFVEESDQQDEPSDQSQTTDEMSEMGLLTEDKEHIYGNSDSLKNWVVDCLPRVSKNLKPEMLEAKFRVQKEILKFLSVQGLFAASLGTEVTSFELQEKLKWPKTTTSSGVCRMCIEKLQLLLVDAQRSDASLSELDVHEPNDLGSYFMRFLDTLWNIPSVSLFRTLSKEDEDACRKLLSTEAWLLQVERGCGHAANKVHAMRCLLIQVLLLVFLRPGEFSEAASELVICCKKAFSSPSTSDDLEKEGEFNDNGTPVLMDVLIDTLLSLLPQSSGPLCFSVEQVFKFFCDDITESGLLRMLRVIKRDLERARHQASHSDGDDDDDDDDDFLGIEEADEIDEAEEAENSDSDNNADDSEAIPEVEGTGKVMESNDSDSGMDDDAMFQMDHYLARIFKERKNSSGPETTQSQLVLFKLRVLSLLEILLHRNAGKPVVLTVYSYLVQAYVNAHAAEGNGQLAQRIGGILQKKIFKAKDYPKGCTDMNLSTLEPLLEKSLRSASRSRQKPVASLAQSSTFWILKIMHGNFPESDLERVLDIFRLVLLDYFNNKKCRLKLGFVKEIFRRHPWMWRGLYRFLLEKCGSARSEFRRFEALSLVDELLKSWVLSKEKDKELQEKQEFLKSHLSPLCDLIHKLLSRPPEKNSKRVEVRRFCMRTMEAASQLGLKKSFIKVLKSHLGDMFLPFEKLLQ